MNFSDNIPYLFKSNQTIILKKLMYILLQINLKMVNLIPN